MLFASGRGVKDLTGETFGYSMAAGVTQFFGIVFLNQALTRGPAGPVSCIQGSNSVLILVLDFIFFSPSVSAQKFIGMGLVLAGVIAMCLAPKPLKCMSWSLKQNLDPRVSRNLRAALSIFGYFLGMIGCEMSGFAYIGDPHIRMRTCDADFCAANVVMVRAGSGSSGLFTWSDLPS
eukprot:gene19257-6528_t